MVENIPATKNEVGSLQSLFKNADGVPKPYIRIPNPTGHSIGRGRVKPILQTQTKKLKSILSEFNQSLVGLKFDRDRSLALLERASEELKAIMAKSIDL